MLNIRLYFTDNNSFSGNQEGFRYLDSFAKTLMWLYSDEADGPDDQYYCLKGVIKMYQLVNVINLLVSHARVELGEATVSEFISDMKKGQGREWRDSQYNTITEFSDKKGDRGMSVKWATDEFIMSILWGGYIYCKAITSLGFKNWDHPQKVMYKVLKEESMLSDDAFKRNWLIKHTDEMVNNMLSDIEERKNKEEKKEVSCPATIEKKQLVKTLKNMDLIIEKLKKENNDLKSKNTLIEEQLEEAKDRHVKEELENWAVEKEDILVELLKPIFNMDKETAKCFAKEVIGQDSIEIIEIVSRYIKHGKASITSVRRKLWSILHAFKIYNAGESNWNTNLNKRI